MLSMIKKEASNSVLSTFLSYIGAIIIGAIMGIALCKLVWEIIFI